MNPKDMQLAMQQSQSAQQLRGITTGVPITSSGLTDYIGKSVKAEFSDVLADHKVKTDTFLSEVVDTVREANAQLLKENADLKAHIVALEERLLKAVDLAHKIMEKYSSEQQVPSVHQLSNVGDGS